MATSAENWSIVGKICIITGANTGIGFETAKELAKRGAAKIMLACRNVVAAEEAAQQIRQVAAASCSIVVGELDLSSLESVRQFVKKINDTEQQLHVLINNAGLHARNDQRLTTKDGFELTFGTNHLGHFLLTMLLLPLLKRSAPSRVVVVASDAYKLTWPRGLDVNDLNSEHRGKYGGFRAYCQSKLINIMFARSLHQRLNSAAADNNKVSVFSLHPGFVNTSLPQNQSQTFRNLFSPIQKMFAWQPERGAETSVYCACQPGIEIHSGRYFSDKKLANLYAIAEDDQKAERLWQLSEQMTGLSIATDDKKN